MRWSWATRWLVAGCVLLPAAALTQSPLTLPPIPEDRKFTQDYAGIIVSRQALEAIAQHQRTAFEQFDTPIMVVTIESMARYGGAGYSIERFAYEWFNNWQIGKRGADGRLINRGMLLLVSRDDRKARIELGADWGHRFDAWAARVMNDEIVPRFKKGDYSGGIAEGVRALAKQAARGPERTESVLDRAASAVKGLGGNSGLNPIPGWAVATLFVVGLLLVIASFFVEGEHRKTVLLVGAVMMAAAVLFWVVLAVIAYLNRDKFGDLNRDRFGTSVGSSGGGYSSSGGFGSGGSSGGGGASGSW